MLTNHALRFTLATLVLTITLVGPEARTPILVSMLAVCALVLITRIHHALTRWVHAPAIAARRAAEADRLAYVITRHATGQPTVSHEILAR